MSIFTNSAGQAPGQAGDYIRALTALVGDEDPLAIQRSLIPEVRVLLAGLTPAQLRTPEAPGKWSMADVLDHLADQELVTGYRYRAVIAESEPPLPGYDQDLWARSLRYATAEPALVLEELDALRRRNLRLLAALEPADMARVGLHAERGRESVQRLIMLMAGHDIVHRRQMARIRAKLVPAVSSVP